MKAKVAFFDFACCEGCQLQIANIGEALLDVLDKIDIVEFREVMSEKSGGVYDVAVIEGSITTKHAVERIKEIRSIAKVLITIGACASIGGVNGMKNNFDLSEIKKYVYGEDEKYFDSVPTMAVDQVVKVDYYVHGCPMYVPEFITVLKHALMGIPYKAPEKSVCTECKLNENECLFDRGLTCMGPVTRAGCNSWCINNGNICYGCRGMLDDPAKSGQMEILKKHDIPLEWVTNKFNMYNKAKEVKENENE